MMKWILVVCGCLLSSSTLWAQDQLAQDQLAQDQLAQDQAAKPVTATDKPDAAKDKDARLAEYLNGCKFIGHFTIDGREGSKEEEYTISKCEKLPADEMFRLTARIKYGDTDSEVPLELPIRWSGSTPVITLDSFWIPGMGTFSARVLIHGERYAGTWQHDDKGGHLYGRIEKLEAK